MKVLVDMNLGLGFVAELQTLGIEARHWSQVGALDAPDSVIMEWARREGFVVLTSDLDFGALLHSTNGVGPSVIQFRGSDLRVRAILGDLINVLDTFRDSLIKGALITVAGKRVRIVELPVKRAN
jgi:predicted nuclease of predicted toxin-antitoxin system